MAEEPTVRYVDVYIDGPPSYVKHIQHRISQCVNDSHGGSVALVLRDENEQVIRQVVEGPVTDKIAKQLAS